LAAGQKEISEDTIVGKGPEKRNVKKPGTGVEARGKKLTRFGGNGMEQSAFESQHEKKHCQKKNMGECLGRGLERDAKNSRTREEGQKRLSQKSLEGGNQNGGVPYWQGGKIRKSVTEKGGHRSPQKKKDDAKIRGGGIRKVLQRQEVSAGNARGGKMGKKSSRMKRTKQGGSSNKCAIGTPK